MRPLLGFVRSWGLATRFNGQLLIMNDKLTTNNVPALRFYEFSGEWEKQSLGYLGDFKNGINKDKSDFGFGFPFVNLMDVFGKHSINSRMKLGAVNATLKEVENYSLQKGDIIFIRSSVKRTGVGETIAVIEDMPDTVFSGFLIRYRETTGALSLEFMRHCFWTTKFRKNILSLSTTSANTNINQESLSVVKVIFPTLPEQQKIASFLASVDTKIEQLGKKKALLGQYKKGVLQLLIKDKDPLTTNHSSLTIRFKDEQGNDFPDWEEKGLGGLIENVGGTALEKFTDLSSRYKFISIGNYSIDGKYIDNGQRVELNKKTKTKLLEKGNLVMVLNDKTASGNIIGSTILIDDEDTYIYNQRSERIICKPSVLPQYLWQYLNSTMFRAQVFRMAQGGTQIYVNFPVVKELKLFLPGLGEQQKIANFLSALDQKLDLIATELTQAQTFKKGLLQQMFV